MLVQAIGALVIAALRDGDNDAWTTTNVYDAILEGERLVVENHPHASATDVVFTCVAGPKQSIAALNPKPNILLDVKYNVADGEPGRPVRRAALSDVDAINPTWRSANPDAFIREFMLDDREPLIFYVNRPAAAGQQVQISYSALPAWTATAVNGSTATLVRDNYQYALTEFALYRLLGHDVENSVNVQRSQQHLANFANSLGIKLELLKTFSPKNPEHKQ